MSSDVKRKKIAVKSAGIEACYGRAHKYKGSLKVISKVGLEANILDIGGGDRRLNLPNFVNVDGSKRKYVDLIADAHHLPFKKDSFELVISEHLLEHVKKPWVVIEEIYRVTKSNGHIYIEVPFMTPYHARPHHYFNMTKEGVEQLCEKFQKVESGVQPYNMPSHTLAMVFSGYLRCLFPFIDIHTTQIEIYDTGTYAPKTASLGLIFLTIYNFFTKILVVLDRFIDQKKAEELAVAIYFVGKKE